MSNVAVIEQAVRPLLTLKGAKYCFVVTRTEDNVGGDDLPRMLVAATRELAVTLLGSAHERHTERMFGHVVVARRFGDVVVCVLGDESLVENEVQRKFNVLAIRIATIQSNEPTSPLIPALREAYVAHAGPLSGLVFDRALDDLRRTRGARDAGTLREFITTLANTVTPPGNHKLLQKAEMILRAAETPSGSFVAAALSAPTPQAFPVPGRTPSGQMRAAQPVPPPVPSGGLRRPTTVPRMAAVQQLTRDYVGPLGDLVVQRALEASTAASGTADEDRFIDTIALQLPEHKRARFRMEARAALDGEPIPVEHDVPVARR